MAREIRPSEGRLSGAQHRRFNRRRLRRAWLHMIICGATWTTSHVALAEVPTGANVVAGAATFVPGAASLDIHATNARSIIDWNSFNIGAGHNVNFHLPDASAAILNRVTTPNMPSSIHGMLQSNGNVYLVNPSGIIVGAGGTINSNAFVASTFDITNQNFLSGGPLQFENSGSNGSIVNHGTIQTGPGGAHLIASDITNHGSIESTGGNITLSSGGTVTLDGGITYVQPRWEVMASGISPTAGLIQNTGSIRASGAASVGGEVYLVNPGGTILHNGTIAAQREPQALASGPTETGPAASAVGSWGGDGQLAGASETGPAASAVGSWGGDEQTGPAASAVGSWGGHVQLEADHITLGDDSRIDASGTHGGGRVLVGGDWQGTGPMHQAISVTMESGAVIDASATEVGDGGRIVLWSDIFHVDSITNVLGKLLAMGGLNGGDGGEIETSGYQLLVDGGAIVSTLAPVGKTGQWLLDPINFTIAEGTGPLTTSGIGNASLNQALLANNVTIQTNAATSGAGHIFVDAEIESASSNSLTLQAHGNIQLNADISIGGHLSLLANRSIRSILARNITTDGGNIVLSANAAGDQPGSVRFDDGVNMRSNGGAITIGGGNSQGSDFAAGRFGIRIAGNSTFLSNGGDISFRGKALAGQPSVHTPQGVKFRGGNVFIDSGTGTILINGTSESTDSTNNAAALRINANVTIHSSSPRPDAIVINADATLVNAFNANASGIHGSHSLLIIADGDGGGIQIQAAGNSLSPSMRLADTSLLASSGNIEIVTHGNPEIELSRWAAIVMGSEMGGLIEQSSSDIIIVVDRFVLGNLQPQFNTTGTLRLMPQSASFASAETWQPALTSNLGSVGGLVLGKLGNTSKLDFLSPLSVHRDIEIHGGDIVIAAPMLTIGSGSIKISSSGQVHTGTTGFLETDALALSGTGTFQLDNGLTRVKTLAFDANNLSLINQSALTIGDVDGIAGIHATGVVDLATISGDLTVAADVITINTSESAIRLGAATAWSAGDPLGGNIIISGSPVISMGEGGRAMLFSGSISDSLGLSEWVGIGSGRFRYNSNQTVANHSAPLESGVFAIYRQQPTLTASVVDVAATYGETPWIQFQIDSIHGDTVNQVFQTLPDLVFDAPLSSSGHFVVGEHVVALRDGVERLGYALDSFADGTLTITPRQLSVIGLAGVDKTYDQTRVATIDSSHAVLLGMMAGDDVSLQSLTGLFADRHAGTDKSISITATFAGADLDNYAIDIPPGIHASITPAPLVVTARDASKRITEAEGPLYAGVDFSGFVGNEDASVLVGSLAITRTLAGENAGFYADSLLPSGLSSNDYQIQFVPGHFTIRPADALRIRLVDANAVYGTSPQPSALTAEYLDGGQAFHTLEAEWLGNDRVSVVDSVGTRAEMTILPIGPNFSGSGNLSVGSYELGASEWWASHNSFSDQVIVDGALQVTAAPVNVITGGLSKVYDGNQSIPDLTLDIGGRLAGDQVTLAGSGQFATRDAGTGIEYVLSGLQLLGNDAHNYQLMTGPSHSGWGGVITPRPVTLTAPTIVRPFDGSLVATASPDHLDQLSSALGVVGDRVGSIVLRFDTPDVGAGKRLMPSQAMVIDGNAGQNYALSYVPSFSSRIEALANGPSGLQATLAPINRQAVTDTNTRYTAASPIAQAPIEIARPTPQVGPSIQAAGNATAPTANVIVPVEANGTTNETFLGKPAQEFEEKKKRIE